MRSRRFDPYGGDGGAANAPTSNTNTALPHGTARQRTLVGNNNGSPNNNVRTTSHNNSYTRVGSGNNITPTTPRTMQPTRSSGNLMRSGSDHGNGIMSHRVHSTQQQQAYPQNNQQSYGGHNTPNAYNMDRGNGYNNMNGGQYNNDNNNHTTNDIVMGKTGAAPLATQVHPLMEVRKRSGAHANNQQQGGAYNPYAGGNDNKQRHSRSRHHQSPYQQSSSSNFFSQSKRIISLLLGQVSEEDMNMLQLQV